MNREQRRAAKRSGRRPARAKRSTLNPVIRAVIEADFKAKFAALRRAAETQCIASDDHVQIAADAGYLLFITLRALQLDQYEIEDADVIDALGVMGNALADINESGSISEEQRAALTIGMDYLDALVQVLSKEALSYAWRQVEDRAHQGDIGTASLNALLENLSGVRVTQHQPKGSMCMSCSDGSAACAQLAFSTMPVIQAYPDGVKAVKCTGHQPTRAERASEEARALWWQEQAKQPRRCISCDAEAPAHLEKGQGLPCWH